MRASPVGLGLVGYQADGLLRAGDQVNASAAGLAFPAFRERNF